jgi:hypothetical protein
MDSASSTNTATESEPSMTMRSEPCAIILEGEISVARACGTPVRNRRMATSLHQVRQLLESLGQVRDGMARSPLEENAPSASCVDRHGRLQTDASGESRDYLVTYAPSRREQRLGEGNRNGVRLAEVVREDKPTR